MVLDVVVAVGQLVPEAGRLVGLHGRPADPLDQQPGEPKRLVADHLGRQPEPRPARQQPVLGVALEQRRRDSRRLPVGRAVTISRSSALTSQPVGRTRSPASRAARDGSAARPASRSLRPSSPARAEEHLPVAVDRHPRRQRVGRVDQPAGQAEPVRPRGVPCQGDRQAGTPGLDARARLVVLARACRTWVARGVGSSSITIVVGMLSTSRFDAPLRGADLRLECTGSVRARRSQETVAELPCLARRAARPRESRRISVIDSGVASDLRCRRRRGPRRRRSASSIAPDKPACCPAAGADPQRLLASGTIGSARRAAPSCGASLPST